MCKHLQSGDHHGYPRGIDFDPLDVRAFSSLSLLFSVASTGNRDEQPKTRTLNKPHTLRTEHLRIDEYDSSREKEKMAHSQHVLLCAALEYDVEVMWTQKGRFSE